MSETRAYLLISNIVMREHFKAKNFFETFFGNRSLCQSFSVLSRTRAFSRLRVHYETRLQGRLLPNQHIGLECGDSSDRYVTVAMRLNCYLTDQFLFTNSSNRDSHIFQILSGLKYSASLTAWLPNLFRSE